MSVWIARVVVLAASVVMIAIRAPHGQRSRNLEVTGDWKGKLEPVLLSVAMLGFFVPLVWLVSPAFSFAEYRLRPLPLAIGIALYAAGLRLFKRSHDDLGRNWSITLQIRAGHELVTDGVYRTVRHPMYSALFLYSLGQMLVLPNWFAGPSYLVTFGILFLLRVRREEAMMTSEFGEAYRAYMKRTRRLIPHVW